MEETTKKTVQLGAKEYALRYSVMEGLELQRRLNRRGITILGDLFGSDADGKFSLRFDLEALLVCLQVGLRHKRAFTEEQLAKLIQEHIDNDHPIGDLIGPVWQSLNDSGCFGFKLKAQEEDEPGKEQAPKGTET